MGSSITFLFADGATCVSESEAGQKLMDVAESVGLSLLVDCSNGQCGTCTAQCVSGKVALDDYDPAVLSDDERNDGAILCCVARVDGPAVIELPYDASDASGEEAPGQVGTVVCVNPIAEEIVELQVEVPVPVNFLPGQYVRLRPEGLKDFRSYSMANESGSTTLVFYVRTVSGGAFSGWLQESAKPGVSIEVSAPRGSFFLRQNDRPRLMVAGGSGLAPMLAMLRHMATNDDGRTAPTRLLVGARSGQHLFALDELESFKSLMPQLQIEIAAESHVPEGAHKGYPTELIEASRLTPQTQIYVCGPPLMVDAARTAALKAGARKSDILCEKFN